jgi:hypothetical protein
VVVRTLRADGLTARSRIVWDILRLVLGLASFFVVTYEFAFAHEPQLLTSLLIYAIDAVLLADLYVRWRQRAGEASSADARRDEGVPRRWWLALLGTLPLDVIFLATDIAPWGISLVLWLRLLRIIRLGTVFSILRRLEHLAISNSAAVRITRLVVVAAILLQLLACIWYLIPFIQGFPADSWAVAAGLGGREAPSSYLLAFYWVVTTMTSVGFGDITPLRQEEYVFAIVVMLAGASLFAYVIASGAALIQSLDLSKVAFWNRVDTVESYLKSRQVDPQVGHEVRRYYEYMWSRHRGVGERGLLADLPPSLRLSVLSELTRDLRGQVPLFRFAPSALRDELIVSLKPVVFPPGADIARAGEIGDGIYFVAAGVVEVLSPDDGSVQAVLEAGTYFGDLTLMLKERRTATVRSRGFTEMFQLTAADFERIRNSYPELRDVLTKASQERSGKMAELVMEGVVL